MLLTFLITIIAFFQVVLLVTIAFLLTWLLALMVPTLWGGPPFVPLKPKRIAAFLELAQLGPRDVMIDLGAGDGRLVLAAAQRGASAYGYEINPYLVLYANYQLWRQGLSGTSHVHWGNFWKVDLRPASVVFVYGFTNIMDRLQHKFEVELASGARVVSAHYKVPGWDIKAEQDLMYLYKR